MDILLVEDNPADAKLVRMLLNDSGHQFHLKHVTTLQAALDTDSPNTILLDLGLPDSTGLGGLEALSLKHPDSTIIVLTGNTEHSNGLHALECGAQDYLIKGECSSEILRRSIEYAIKRKGIESELMNVARIDPVTGLVNRAYFLSLFEHAIKRGERDKSQLALLFMDLDHFKHVNDKLGHDVGDQLLKQIGNRLTNTIRKSDIAARLGGDEFTLIMENLVSPASALAITENIITSFQDSFLVQSHEIFITPSIGVATYPDAGTDSDTLIKHADIAMYHAKSKGRNTASFYTAEMSSDAREIFDFESGLRTALDNKELRLEYQPIIDCLSNKVVAAEALIRWKRQNSDTLIKPDRFIPILEQSSLICDVGKWVLETACKQCREWHDVLHTKIRVSVNVSPYQLMAGEFIPVVEHALMQSGLDPQYLEIEITESISIDNNADVSTALVALKRLGVSLAIDDFGVGFSTLKYLTAFPFDTVKIDKSFITSIPGDTENTQITSGVLHIAHGLGRKVIAEGVETQEQLEFLKTNHCEEVQGFYYSEPIPKSDFVLYCQDRQE